jgi:methyltransferase (TIGR00027 family)
MPEGRASVTARRVAVHRLGFDRPPTDFGDPDADERLARDVAASAGYEPGEGMTRYLRGRTSFFDRSVVHALDRDVGQIVIVGAGYDGRALRYARPGVRWYEVDHPDTQDDKRARLDRLGIATPQIAFVATDLVAGRLADDLLAAGYDVDAPSQILCEGVAAYLDVPVVTRMLADLRALTTVGTRLAISLSSSDGSVESLARRQKLAESVGAVGEPIRTSLTADDTGSLLGAARWRPVDIPERARRAGFVVAVPDWTGAGATTGAGTSGPRPTTSRMGRYMERTFHRAGTDDLGAHLETTYGITVESVHPLDVGVFHIRRADGPPWVARVHQAERLRARTDADVRVLDLLARADFPAERCAAAEPVSMLAGQAVLVTGHVAGRKAGASRDTYRRLGELLGRLHTTAIDADLAEGGAWHHLAPEGGPGAEIDAAVALLDDAGPRVRTTGRDRFERLRAEVAGCTLPAGLPSALSHPDLVPPNAIATAEGDLHLIDWTGAGPAPRIWTLGWLLWAAGRPGYIDAVMAGYGVHVELDDAERARLPTAVRARAVVLECWSYCTGRVPLGDVTDGLPEIRARADVVAARASRR